MQVFTPYDNPFDCAKALWNDKKRFNKQLIEGKQILNAINGISKGWVNHPVTKMYKPYQTWLYNYINCLAYYGEYKKGYLSPRLAQDFSEKANSIKPPFLTKEFCNQHKRRLFTKAPNLYADFAEYGTSEENWYVINGKLVKYLKGKLLNK